MVESTPSGGVCAFFSINSSISNFSMRLRRLLSLARAEENSLITKFIWLTVEFASEVFSFLNFASAAGSSVPTSRKLTSSLSAVSQFDSNSALTVLLVCSKSISEISPYSLASSSCTSSRRCRFLVIVTSIIVRPLEIISCIVRSILATSSRKLAPESPLASSRFFNSFVTSSMALSKTRISSPALVQSAFAAVI